MGDQSLLIISENENGFLVNTIREAVEQTDISAYTSSMGDPGLSMLTNTVTMYMLSIGTGAEIDVTMRSVISLLMEKCYAGNRKIILYGDQVQIHEVKRIIPEGLIAETILRPIEPSEVASRVVTAFKKLEVYKNKKNVLVVDDSGMMLRTIMGWLEGKYKVMLANSAATAAKAIEKEIPDLILLDYEMPMCSGAQFMSMLKSQESTKNIPIIFLTSRDDKATVKEVLSLRPEGYILKSTPQEVVIKYIDDFFVRDEE